MTWAILLTGIGAQFFYTTRALIQWIQSERSRKIESPTLFWIFSIMGSILFFIYGWLRHDFSILLGEFLSYYIYVWNLKIKGAGRQTPALIQGTVFLFPIAMILLALLDLPTFTASFFQSEDLPLYMIVWGSVGQFIYKMRFVYQWYYSSRRQESLLPVTFWWIAFVGSLMIMIYGIYRLDWILIIGQLGIIATIRNIMIGRRAANN